MDTQDKTMYFMNPKDGQDSNLGTSEDAPLKTPTGFAIAVMAAENPWVALCYWCEGLGRYVEL